MLCGGFLVFSLFGFFGWKRKNISKKKPIISSDRGVCACRKASSKEATTETPGDLKSNMLEEIHLCRMTFHHWHRAARLQPFSEHQTTSWATPSLSFIFKLLLVECVAFGLEFEIRWSSLTKNFAQAIVISLDWNLQLSKKWFMEKCKQLMNERSWVSFHQSSCLKNRAESAA